MTSEDGRVIPIFIKWESRIAQRSPPILLSSLDRFAKGGESELSVAKAEQTQIERQQTVMMGRVALVLQLVTLAACAALAAAASARTAVVLDSLDIQQTHSKFFQLLQARGHALEFFSNDPELALEKYGVRTFDNLIVFSPQKKLGKLGKSDLLNFVETGGNILLSSSTKLTKVQRDFALECGVEYEKKGNLVMDHVSPIRDDSDIYNSVIAASDFVKSDRVVGAKLASSNGKKKPVAFSGIGMTLEPNNILGFHALVAPGTAYSANPVKEITAKVVESDLLFGNEIGLVTAIQARNNARLVFAGSLDLFSDKYFTDAFSNELFSDAVSKWVFQESGVLRATNVQHHRADGSSPDKMLKDSQRADQPLTLYPDAEIARDSLVYRVKDNLTYSFDIHELKGGQWVAYAASDVQLEFVMLDPHVRKTMSHDGKGHFSVTFEAPDTYGIFLFRVMYRRLGLSTIQSSTQVSLRPFKHDEYERFIPAAYPYYVSAFSMMAGVFLFSVFFLFYQEKNQQQITTHRQLETRMPPAKKVVNGVKTDGLFSWVEDREAALADASQQQQPWGRVLDAGTGRHSLSWLLGFAARHPASITEVVAVTGERQLANTLTKEFADHAAGIPLHVYAGNWVNDEFLQEEEAQKFDVIIADYLVGAIEGFAPFYQDAIIERIARHLKPGGRIYLVGLQPLSECAASNPESEDDVSAAALVQEMARVRDACILLAGRRCYREFPMSWCERQLRVAGFRVDGSIKLANVYKRETVQRQLQVAKNQFIWFNDDVAQEAMNQKIGKLEQRTAALFDGGKKIRFGFDYVLAASKSA